MEQNAERESLFLHLGRLARPDDLVFANAEGKPIAPGVLSHAFARIPNRAGLENVRFHDLRHTFASLMLLRRAKPKVISEALGHSGVAFTIDVYSHMIEGMQQDAMFLLDGVLPKAKNGVSWERYCQINASIKHKVRSRPRFNLCAYGSADKSTGLRITGQMSQKVILRIK